MSINLLTQAVKEKDLETIELLIKKGVDVNSKDKSGKTPLYWAAEYGRTNVVKLLLKAGADVNATVSDGPLKGYTPLHEAAYLGHKDTVKVLIKAEADVNTNPN